MRPALAFLLAASLTSCVSSDDDDNFSWTIVSNPSGGSVPVSGGLVLSWRYSSKNFSLQSGRDDAGNVALKLAEVGGPDGTDPTNWRDFWLGVDNDHLVVLERSGGAIHSAALPAGSLVIPVGSRVAAGIDTATGLHVTTTEGVYHLARNGNVIVFDHPKGITVFRQGQRPEEFAAGSKLEAAGTDFWIDEGARRTLIKVTPSADVGSQVRYDGGRDSYRFRSYALQTTAELPAGKWKVYDGSTGLKMDGDFPDAAGGALDSPFRAVLASRNHHLLLIRRR